MSNPSAPFEKLLATVSDEDLETWETQYEQDIARLEVMLTGVRAAKAARKAMQGDDVDSGFPPRPNSQVDAVRAVMAAAPSTPWRAETILQALRQRGWEPRGQTPKNSVDATLSRMTAEGIVRRIDRGLYLLAGADTVSSGLLELQFSSPNRGDPDLI